MDVHQHSEERTPGVDALGRGTTEPSWSPQAEDLLRRLRAGELVPGIPDPVVPEAEQGPDPRGHRSGSVSGLRTRLSGAFRDRLPVAVRGALVDPALRSVLGLGLVALLAALAALGLVWRGAPRPVAVPPVPVVSGSAPSAGVVDPATATASGGVAPSGPSPAASSALASRVLVDVAGRVRRPGVVSLAPGARVDDALQLAGGVLPGTDTSALSLARKVVDGEQILVTGKPGSAAAASGAGAGSPSTAATAGGDAAGSPDASVASGTSGAPGAPLDLNSATVDQLDALPGVGPVLAGRIVEWRTAHGGFTSVDQLREVKGLGGKTGSELLPLVRVG